MSTIEERVKKIIGEQLGVKQEEVTNNASFVEDLGADSLDTVELVMALEEEFDINQHKGDYHACRNQHCQRESRENAKGVNGGLERRNDPSNQQAI